MLQAARFASCQGNINCTEAIVLRKDECEVWEDLEECVSGFNVQIIDQCSHLLIWLTNLNAWYGQAVDGISSVSLAGATTKYHGWNYEFLDDPDHPPRLMSFPTERTEILLRFESGQAVANAIAAGVGLGLGNCLIAFGRVPGGVEKAFGLPPHYRFTWGHAIGYPLESADAGASVPGCGSSASSTTTPSGGPTRPTPPPSGSCARWASSRSRRRSRRVRRDRRDRRAPRPRPGLLHFPAREIRRLLDDDDWELGPRLREHAESVLATEELRTTPTRCAITFRKLMEEHGIDAAKFLPADG